MNSLNPLQTGGALRIILGYAVTNLVTWLIAHGLVLASSAGPLTDALITVVSVLAVGAAHIAYSMYASRTSALATTVAASPNLSVTTPDAAIAAAIPGVTLDPKS